MFAMMMAIGSALPASGGLPVLTPDDNLGLVALVAGLLVFWGYFRSAGDDPE